MPTAPEIAPTAACVERALQALGVAVGLEREAGELDAERGRLGVHAVRAADAQRVGVLARALGQRVAASSRAPGRTTSPARAQLQRQRRVEHVGGRQPVVDPAPGLARRRRDSTSTNAATSWSVTFSRSCTASTVNVARADRLEVVRASARRAPRRPATSTSRQRLHAGLVGPDGAELGAGVARDHGGEDARRQARAALRALSTPTHATGTPGGICAIDSSASSPPATDVRDVSGTPITGRSVCAATTPGSAADRPGAGDDHLQPAHLRVACA